MNPPPDDGGRPPLLVRYLLGNVRTRSAGVWLVVATLIFVVVAVALQDVILIALAVAGVAAYLWSIRWMDRHDAWPGDAEPAGTEPAARAGDPDGPAVDVPAPPDLTDPASRPAAIESLRRSAFDAPSPAAPAATASTDQPGSGPSRLVARAVAALIAIATVTQLGALVALEAGGDDPTGAHLVEVMLDALFGLGFGAFAIVVALQRQRLPAPRVLSVIASVGLGLVAGLGYYIAAAGLVSANANGPGQLAGWLIGVAAAGAGVWLTATGGGRFGILIAIPAVLIGWYLGVGTWVAHVNAV